MERIEYPIRINRYLLLKNLCSRREADRLIESGKVTVNGAPAVLGQKVQEDDIVEVDAEVTNRVHHYYLYHKPIGVVSHNPQRDEESVAMVSGLGPSVSPVGRLDKNSRGLMLLTDDGRIVNAVLHPDYAHEREYEVVVDKYIKEGDLKKMAKGVDIEGYVTKPSVVKRLDDDAFSITLTEGKKHQIRRMCAALGYAVTDLVRVRMMHLPLDIREGEHRALTKPEITKLLKTARIPTN